MKSRRQRRQEARESGVPFEPQYSSGMKNGQQVGGEPKTYEEMYGVGYERFDGKYVKVSDKITEEER